MKKTDGTAPRRGIRSRIIFYLLLFAAGVLVMLWLLQIVFLEGFYRNYRIRQVTGLAERLAQYTDVFEMKYEADGGPSIADCMSVMRRMRMTATSQLAFIDSIAFNYIIGNADAHAKNLSVVYHGKSAVLAPLYDLVSTVVYPELSREMAMGIGGEMRFSAITRANFSRMANDCGVSPKLVLSRLDALCGRVTTAAERLAEEFNASWPSGMYGKVIETIKSHAAHVAPPALRTGM